MANDKKNNIEEQEELNGIPSQEVQDEVSEENPSAESNELETLREDVQKEKEKFLRLFAEFENYKKRTSKERLELYATASESVMTALLPVLDDLDRALIQIADAEENDHTKGFTLISNKLKDALVSKGLTEVELTKGDAFDADIAEAVTQIPAGDDLKGKVVDVIEKGYKLGEKIIRFPKVVIGQ